jgi:3' terminal RNA ribose 2'-O-methyltransferase Hen1
MLLTITCEAEQATDLGYLLHKNPANLFEKETWFGKVRVFYSEVEERRCTVAVLLEVDPVGLVRGKSTTLDQYVNDRPYVASSLMSVALGDVFGTALGGRSKERPERVGEVMPLQARLAAVDCDGGEALIRRLLEPLGYLVNVERAVLDERFPHWGESDLYTITLEGRQTVQDLLAHLYVLIPVLDNRKHYYVDEAEIDKLMRRGEGWLAAHPDKELIARRYLLYRKRYVRAALDLLREGAPDEEAEEAEEERIEAPVRLNEARLQSVLAAVRAAEPPARRVIDLGCGEGRLLEMLLKERGIEQIVGVDVSSHILARADERLHLDRMPERQRARIQLIQGSLVYQDGRFSGFDAATLVEVIEHLDPPRLAALEQVVFRHARPRRVIVTTPNAEYNAHWPSLPAGKFRHRDHRFEWTRAQLRAWADAVGQKYNYVATHQGIGPEDTALGCPTQMAVFDVVERPLVAD